MKANIDTLFDWSGLLVLLATMVGVTWGLGGWLRGGAAMSWATGMIALVVVLHGLWWFFNREKPRRLNPLPLLFLPFLLWVWISQSFITPAPWYGRLELAMWLLAFTVLWFTVNGARSPRRLWWAFSATAVAALAALMVALTDLSFDPAWLPYSLPMNRAKPAEFLQSASGSLGLPATFAGLMLMLIPFFVIAAYVKRFPGQVRILCGGLALAFAVGVALSVEGAGYSVLALLLVFIPVFIGETSRQRVKAFLVLLAVVVVVGSSLFFFNFAGKQRVKGAFERVTAREYAPTWAAGRAMFAEQPLIGQGVQSFDAEWEQHRPALPAISPTYARSGYIGLLADYGLIGTLLLLGPILYVLYLSLRERARMPLRRLSRDERFRQKPHKSVAAVADADSANRSNPSEGRRRHRRKSGHSRSRGRRQNTPRVVLGGLSLGVVAFLLHLAVEFHLKVPLLVFVFMILLGVLVRYISRRTLEVRGGFVTGVAGLGLAIFWGILLMAVGRPAFEAAELYQEARERTQAFMANPMRLLLQPAYYPETADLYERVLGIQPKHADALAGFAALKLLQAPYEDAASQRELLSEARDLAGQAVQINPDNWTYHAYEAMAMGQMGADYDVLLSRFQQVRDLAQANPNAWFYLANFLSQNPNTRTEALAAVDEALALDPDHAAAQDLRERLVLN